MGFDAHVLKVMISSPGDTTQEVEALKSALHSWNGSRAENAQTVLLPRFWKTDAVPTLSTSGGQSVINSQLVDDADIVIVLFDSRLGQATDTAVSGTAEEIERAAAGGKPVHVWFSDEPIGRDADLEELARLQKFRKELEAKGLLGVYADLTDLAYKVRDAIESDVNGLALGAVGPIKKKGEHAIPVVRYTSRTEQTGTDSKNKPKFRTSERLVIENKSQTVTAEQLTIELGELTQFVIEDHGEPFDLHPLTEMQWIMGLHMGAPLSADVVIRWVDNGEVQERTQKVSLAS